MPVPFPPVTFAELLRRFQGHGCTLEPGPSLMTTKGPASSSYLRRVLPDGTVKVATLPGLSDRDAPDFDVVRSLCAQTGISMPDVGYPADYDPDEDEDDVG